jgi:hypothetical protein
MIGILVAIQAHLVATVVVHKLSVVCELGMPSGPNNDFAIKT